MNKIEFAYLDLHRRYFLTQDLYSKSENLGGTLCSCIHLYLCVLNVLMWYTAIDDYLLSLSTMGYKIYWENC